MQMWEMSPDATQLVFILSTNNLRSSCYMGEPGSTITLPDDPDDPDIPVDPPDPPYVDPFACVNLGTDWVSQSRAQFLDSPFGWQYKSLNIFECSSVGEFWYSPDESTVFENGTWRPLETNLTTCAAFTFDWKPLDGSIVLSQGSYGLFRAVLVTDSMTSGHTIQDDMILVQQHLLFTYNINSTQILPEHFCGPDETLLGDDIVSEQTLGELFVEPTLIPENNISEGVLSTTSLIQQHLLVNDQLNSGQILNELFVEPILITEDNTSEQSLDELFIEPNLLVDDIESEQSIAETTLEL